MAIRRWMDKRFWLEEIDGDGLCPVYLYRWTLLKFKTWSVYLHKFVGDDWSRDLHDHPKRFYSIGLRGCYVEEQGNGGERFYAAPWIRTFPATHIHRLRLAGSRMPCWTMVIVLRPVRAWGFWHGGQWIPWQQYVDSDTAVERKACP